MAKERVALKDAAKPRTRPGDELFEDKDTAKFLSDLQQGLKIDKTELDEASIVQPELFFRVSDRLALAQSRRDAVKQWIDVVEARVDGEVRARAIANEEKLSESAIRSRITLDAEVIAANNDLLRLNHAVMEVQALKDAFQQRSYVLKDLTQLHSTGYFQDNGPRARASEQRKASEGEYRRPRS